ncbi:MAG: hypothetical protein IPK10_09835 [Bacteroidetes bacterium]|nr:hypothetical protein [Bacteroidota bacterium]
MSGGNFNSTAPSEDLSKEGSLKSDALLFSSIAPSEEADPTSTPSYFFRKSKRTNANENA